MTNVTVMVENGMNVMFVEELVFQMVGKIVKPKEMMMMTQLQKKSKKESSRKVVTITILGSEYPFCGITVMTLI